MITNTAKFLSLVHQKKIITAYKSYNDTLLFYYIGNLALSNGTGNLFEIGIGGSSYPLMELSSDHSRKFIAIDVDIGLLNNFVTSKDNIFSKSIIESYHIDSNDLPNRPDIVTNNLSYCHIDGSKDYETTLNDLKYCIDHLANNGIICQDDYGNNKWPTITDAVQNLIYNGQLTMLVVGDSSCWLTKPEYYNYWMDIFSNDIEFQILSPFVNLTNSKNLNKNPNYFFMNALESKVEIVPDNEILDYYDSLLELIDDQYLRMPFEIQSLSGVNFRITQVPFISEKWDVIKGINWPKAPENKNDIDNLSEEIKKELIDVFNFMDVYSMTYIIEDKCKRT